MKLSFKPNKRTRVRTHGFRERMKTADGRQVIARRRLAGRAKLTVSDEQRKYIANHMSMSRTRRVRGIGRSAQTAQATA